MNDALTPSSLPIAVLGGGNLGAAIARGIVRSGFRAASGVALTRRRTEALAELAADGHPVGADNRAATASAGIVLLAVQPNQILPLLEEIRDGLVPGRHLIVSTATSVTIAEMRTVVGAGVPVLRAMPNLGIQTLSSMTCLAADAHSEAALPEVEALFAALGATVRVEEGQMAAFTALCASGIAFFLRAIRAASQGGVEIGFHAEDAIRMAAQTAKGAAELLLTQGRHPEAEIDQVTTPGGCTIAGLNDLVHRGFTSAMVGGIRAAARRAGAPLP